MLLQSNYIFRFNQNEKKRYNVLIEHPIALVVVTLGN